MSCLTCDEIEGWGPMSKYFDLTPCFLYGAAFNFINLITLIGGLILIYSFIFENKALSINNSVYKITFAVALRFCLILLQFGLKLSLIYVEFIEYFSISSVIKNAAIFDNVVLILIIVPLTYLDHKKIVTTSSVLLLYWLLQTLFSVFKFSNVTTRYYIQASSLEYDSLFVSKFHVAISLILAVNSIFIMVSQSMPKAINKNTNYALMLQHERESKHPLDFANLYNRLIFGWMTPLMKLGYSKYLVLEDVPKLPTGLDNEAATDALLTNFNKEIAIKKQNASLWKCLLSSFGPTFLIASFFKVIQDILSFTQPQLLKILINFVNQYQQLSKGDSTVERPHLVKGFNIAFAMLLTSVCQSLSVNQYFYHCYSGGIKVKSSLIGAIYKKSLVLSPESRTAKSTGDIVNLMSIDTQRLQDLTEYGQIIWSGPFQIFLCLFSLYQILQNSMWLGFIFLSSMVFGNYFLAKYQKTLQKTQMKYKDSRIKLVSEILSNIKSLKLYNWEKPYKQKLEEWRNGKELKNLSHIATFKAINLAIWNIVPFFVSCATFFGYVVLYGKPLTTDKVFPALALFNLLGFPLAMIPNVLTSIIDASVSVKRLHDFLVMDEIDPDVIKHAPKAKNIGDVAVSVENASFSWNKQKFTDADEDLSILKNINFKATKGELSCIIGKVASGKSSFIKSLLGDLYKYSGNVTLHGKVAYVSQVAWIMNGTIKENILFGHRYDPILYAKVLEACDLHIDLKSFVDGDLTQVGEKGISLSGGQKARLSLARAIYSGADVYLLDDPLAAVDEHVGKHLIDKVFGNNGLLNRKCKILVTNSVHFLHIADNITLLENGAIVEQCTNESLSKLSDKDKLNSKVYQLIEQFGKRKQSESEESTTTKLNDSSELSEVETFTGHEIVEIKSITNDVPDENGSFVEDLMDGASLRRASTVSEVFVSYDDEDDKQDKDTSRKEHLERGKVKWDVYRKYFTACNPRYVFLFVFIGALSQLTDAGAKYWLKHWSEVNTRYDANPHYQMYLGVYAFVGVCSGFCWMAQSLVLWQYSSISGSRIFHDKLTNSIMRAPMSFFETTPIGRILNRFSNDINKIDEVLARSFNGFFNQLLKVSTTFVIIFLSTWEIILVLIPLSVLYLYYQQFYMRTSRELKRLESVTRSPIYAHFQETLSGISTIRGYDHTNRFVKLNTAKVDTNLSAFHPTVNSNRWLSTRLEFLGTLIIFSSAALPLFALNSPNVTAGLIGLSVSYALQITGSLNWSVRMTVEIETNIVSVERIEEYANLKPEAPEVIESHRPEKTWPKNGEIEFKHYSTRYRDGLDLVLQDISIKIKGQEKVGIVGRTGAGKSSLTMALFRIIEAAEGEIDIDGVSTASIGLSDLRTKLSIIPQDAQVFEGSIRDNLDPTRSFSDADVLNAIKLSHLNEHLEKIAREQNAANETEFSTTDYLNVAISENGSNLSVGQKQLVCLARALLIPTRILVLDEATAAVDVETDKIVQETIRKEFKSRTILTIAHRINTIMDSDRILVLDKGEVAEFDKPEILLQNKDSIFYSLAKQGGLVE